MQSGVNDISSEVIAESLGVYTGYEDKIQTPIFSSFPIDGVMTKGGDLVQQQGRGIIWDEPIESVTFDDGAFVLSDCEELNETNFARILVVGKQLDNPELIESE